ncbi:hypothetical protein [Streptomyces sp. NPDC020917]|uniref:hypothetical protein n=1 Tax=Streptomyces sp. NPDC020917 TaxID=3365102 RepID=UPI0037AEEEDC
MNSAHDAPVRVLIVGRSPGVLLDAVAMLRAKGYAADATNQFDSVLEDYDVSALDVLLFGGMVPPDTKQRLREAIVARSPRVTVVQGLAGIAGVIAAQVETLDAAGTTAPADIAYDSARRTVRVMLPAPAHVTVEAWWGTSFTPPEPTSTSLVVCDRRFDAGSHTVAVPEDVPSVASFAVVRTGSTVRVVTLGALPSAVTRRVPTSASDRRLPDVAPVTTKGDDR